MRITIAAAAFGLIFAAPGLLPTNMMTSTLALQLNNITATNFSTAGQKILDSVFGGGIKFTDFNDQTFVKRTASNSSAPSPADVILDTLGDQSDRSDRATTLSTAAAASNIRGNHLANVKDDRYVQRLLTTRIDMKNNRDTLSDASQIAGLASTTGLSSVKEETNSVIATLLGNSLKGALNGEDPTSQKNIQLLNSAKSLAKSMSVTLDQTVDDSKSGLTASSSSAQKLAALVSVTQSTNKTSNTFAVAQDTLTAAFKAATTNGVDVDALSKQITSTTGQQIVVQATKNQASKFVQRNALVTGFAVATAVGKINEITKALSMFAVESKGFEKLVAVALLARTKGLASADTEKDANKAIATVLNENNVDTAAITNLIIRAGKSNTGGTRAVSANGQATFMPFTEAEKTTLTEQTGSSVDLSPETISGGIQNALNNSSNTTLITAIVDSTNLYTARQDVVTNTTQQTANDDTQTEAEAEPSTSTQPPPAISSVPTSTFSEAQNVASPTRP
ncbi:MAG: hypothetical protein JKY34_15405 [Kordiimonadaceae bacterium]|nr:hypothetical protein [Kordiimonadaceae bacterium]